MEHSDRATRNKTRWDFQTWMSEEHAGLSDLDDLAWKAGSIWEAFYLLGEGNSMLQYTPAKPNAVWLLLSPEYFYAPSTTISEDASST